MDFVILLNLTLYVVLKLWIQTWGIHQNCFYLVLTNSFCYVGILYPEPKVCVCILKLVLMLVVFWSINVVMNIWFWEYIVVLLISTFLVFIEILTDESIFDCLLTLHISVQKNDSKSCFIFIGDFNIHHRDWMNSVSPTDQHGISASDLDVSSTPWCNSQEWYSFGPCINWCARGNLCRFHPANRFFRQCSLAFKSSWIFQYHILL